MFSKKVNIQIKSIWGTILFEYKTEDNTIKKTVVEADLQGADLQGADLQGADLQEANLRGTDLRRANLRGADLWGADLQGANLWGANLWGADLWGADLQGANLWEANLRGANLRGAKNLSGIHKCDLSILTSQKGKLRAYKFLDSDFKSPYQETDKITYKIGKTYQAKINTNKFLECGAGLNVATLEWCLRESNCNLTKIYIEVEFDAKDIIVPYFSDGKFRVKKLKVLRQLKKKELEDIIKPLK